MKIIKNIKIHYSFFICLVFFLVAGLFFEFLLVMSALILHELGHLAFIFFFKRKINKITFYPFGAIIDYNELQNDFNYKNLLIASGGIMVNLSICIVCFLLSLKKVAYVNLLFLLINFIPVFPLDGGRILLSLLGKIFPFKIAKKIIYIMSIAVAIFLGVFGLIYYRSFYLIIVILVLIKINYFKLVSLKKEYLLFTTEKYLSPNDSLPKKKTRRWLQAPFYNLFCGKNTIFDYESFLVPEDKILNDYYESKDLKKEK